MGILSDIILNKRKLDELERRLNEMAGEISALTAAVSGLAETVQNMVLLVNQQGAMIEDLQAGQIDLTPVVNATETIKAADDLMKEAIDANKPTPPAP
jgi:uncharacterized protein YoxC